MTADCGARGVLAAPQHFLPQALLMDWGAFVLQQECFFVRQQVWPAQEAPSVSRGRATAINGERHKMSA